MDLSRRSFLAAAGALAGGLTLGVAPRALAATEGTVAPLRPAVTLDATGRLTFVVDRYEGVYYGFLLGRQVGTGHFETTPIAEEFRFIYTQPATLLDVTGRLVYFAVEKFDSLVEGWETAPGSFESTTISTVAALPGVCLDATGRIAGIYAFGDSLTLLRQHTPGSGPWDLTTITSPARPGRPAVVVDAAGRLTFLSCLEDGSLLYGVEQEFGGAWDTAIVATGASDEPTALLDNTGRLTFFARFGDTLSVGRQDQPGGTSFPLTVAGLGVQGSPAGALDANGRLTFFARETTGELLHGWQDSPDLPWQGTTLASGLAGDPGVGLDAHRGLNYFVALTDGTLLHGWQDAPGAGPWHSTVVL
jgi:hypothetical protein